MLKLENQKLIGEILEPVSSYLKINYQPDEKDGNVEYYIVFNGKAGLLTKENDYLVWLVPDSVNKNNFRIKIQAVDKMTRSTLFFTNELIITTITSTKSVIDNGVTKIVSTTIMEAVEFDPRYKIYDMIDEHLVIPVNDRVIIMPTDYKIVVARDNVSQLLTFEINRYYDGVDLFNKACSIKYKNAIEKTGKAIAVNVSFTDDKLTIGWLLDKNVAIRAGVVTFLLEFIGYNEHDQLYRWQTVPSQFEVEEGLFVDDVVIEELYPTIIEDLQIQIRHLQSLIGEAGTGVPTGGVAGQVLTKVGDDDFDIEWTYPTGGQSYTHNQDTVSNTWSCPHGLGSIMVSAIILDSNGNEVVAFIDRQASTENTLIIRFSRAISGVAHIKL